MDSKLLLLLYNAFILPFITYATPIWGSTYDYRLQKLHKLQKKIVRLIDGADRLAHSSPLFRKYNILKIHDLVGFSKLKILHEFLSGRLPAPLANKFTLLNDQTARNARVAQHFQVPFSPTMYRKFTLYVSAPRIWNTVLASKIKNLNNVPHNKAFFKKVAKKLYLDSY